MLPLGLLAVVCMAGCGEKAVSERQQPNIRLITKEVSLGKLQPGIVGESVVASPDSKRVAYVAQRDGEWLAVVDGIAGEEYDYIGLGGFFSPDSKRVAYAAQRGEKWLVVVDGVEGIEYDGISDVGIVFSPDSKRVVYAAQRGKKWLEVVDGIDGEEHDLIGECGIVFSPDSKRVCGRA